MRVIRFAGSALFVCSALVAIAAQTSPNGGALYAEHCAACHDGTAGGDARAPNRDALGRRAPQAIVDALTSGSMRYQGMPLNGVERRAIAAFLAGASRRSAEEGLGASAACRPASPFTDPSLSPSWNGWSPAPGNAHFQSESQAGIVAAQVPRLKLRWAFGFPDAAASFAQPTVAGGRVFIGSQNGNVYSLDAKRGCVAWTFMARAGVRAAVVVDKKTAYAADQSGNIYALDAATGALQWTRRVDEHPLVRLTGAPALYAGRLYVPTSSYEEGGKPPGYGCCTFRGSLVALEAKTGDVVWQTYTIAQKPILMREYADGSQVWGPSGGAIWSSPTIDAKRGAIYVGTGNTYSGRPQKTTDAILAIDLKSGAIRWTQQMTPGEYDVFGCAPGEVNCGGKGGPDFDFGASPVMVTVGGRDLVVAGQKSGVLYALDPDRKGRLVWRYRAGGGSGLGGIQWGIAADGERAYAPVADIYAEMPGGLHAVDLATGTRAWYAPPPPPACGRPNRACSGAQFSAVTVIPGVVFSPSNDGAVRAYSTRDGSVLWTFDTNHEFPTVNGVKAHGGSMNGPAPVVAGGIVYMASGYGTFGLRPGNILLAFDAQ